MSEIIFHIIVITAGVFSIVKGFRSGLLRQTPDLLGMAFGAGAARIFCDDAEPKIREWITFFDNPVTEGFIYCMLTCCALYAAGFLVFRTLTLVLRKILSALDAGIADNIFGACFSLLNNMMWLSVVLNILLCLNTRSTLMKYASQDDGNVVELVMLLAPALTGAFSCHDLAHVIQLDEAKKISLNNLPPDNVITIKTPVAMTAAGA